MDSAAPLPMVPGLAGNQRYVRVRRAGGPPERPEDGNILSHAGQGPPAPPQRGATAPAAPRGPKDATGGAAPAGRAGQSAQCAQSSEAVFRFFGHIDETVTEGGVREVRRIRPVTVLYHAADGTFSVLEKRQANSGMPQGTLLRRSKVPAPGGGDQSIGLADVRVGALLALYGLRVHVTDADARTRAHFEGALGRPLAAAQPTPQAEPPAARGGPRADAAQRASERLKYHRRESVVLRFSGVDVSSGSRRFEVAFYYQNDTVEVREAGRLLLRRQKLPKDGSNFVPNTVCGSLSSSPDDAHVSFLSLEDLSVGAALDVYGTAILITSGTTSLPIPSPKIVAIL